MSDRIGHGVVGRRVTVKNAGRSVFTVIAVRGLDVLIKRGNALGAWVGRERVKYVRRDWAKVLRNLEASS